MMDALLLQVEKVQHPCVLTQLHKHRNVLGVIGVCHCPSTQSIGSAYEQFEQLCRQVTVGHEDSQLDCTASRCMPQLSALPLVATGRIQKPSHCAASRSSLATSRWRRTRQTRSTC